MRLVAVLSLLVLAAILMVPAASLVYEAGGSRACARCHEMDNQVDLWIDSAHRNVGCAKCHGDALSADPTFHLTNARRVWSHWRGDVPEQFRLRPGGVFEIVERCASCHQQEFAAWSTGPHAVTYKRIFTDEKHNSTRHLMEDCLRCHGAHFDGGIQDLVAPLNNRGPWRLVRGELAGRPAVPCLACHAVHRKGAPLNQRLLESKTLGNRQEKHRPGLAYFDRRSQSSISASMLPIPAMLDLGRPVRMSQDPRQALCYQCHAPLSTREAGSGDDRTPKGVHEGLSCLACHDRHRQTTRASCGTCHPRLSNCGLDVETMDTTFAKPNSRHNIHFVKCTDCHPRGVPQKKRLQARSGAAIAGGNTAQLHGLDVGRVVAATTMSPRSAAGCCRTTTRISPVMFCSANNGGPALLDSNATVKRLSVRGAQVEFRSENACYKPIPVDPESDFRIVGMVIGLWKRPARTRGRAGPSSRLV